MVSGAINLNGLSEFWIVVDYDAITLPSKRLNNISNEKCFNPRNCLPFTLKIHQ